MNEIEYINTVLKKDRTMDEKVILVNEEDEILGYMDSCSFINLVIFTEQFLFLFLIIIMKC